MALLSIAAIAKENHVRFQPLRVAARRVLGLPLIIAVPDGGLTKRTCVTEEGAKSLLGYIESERESLVSRRHLNVAAAA